MNRRIAPLLVALFALVVAAPAGATQLFAPVYYPDEVSVFNVAADGTATEIAGSPFPVGTYPTGAGIGAMALTPDGSHAAVSYYFNGGIQGLNIASSGAVTPAQPIQGSNKGGGLAVTPDGRFAYQAIGSASGGVDAYAFAADGSLTAVPGSPFLAPTPMYDVVVSPDGRFLYACDGASIQRLTIGGDGAVSSPVSTPVTGARFMLFTSDGKHLIVQTGSQTLGVVPVGSDGSLGAIGNIVTVGSTSIGFPDVSHDGRFLYAVDYNGDTLGSSNYSVNTYSIGADSSLSFVGAGSTLPLRGRALGIAPDGKHMYLGADSGRIGVAPLGADGVPGAFKDTGAWPSGETIPLVFRPAIAGTAAEKHSPSTKPLSINFDASASTAGGGALDSYSWDFGDGTSANVTSPRTGHAYKKPGVYSARLTVLSEGCGVQSLYNGHTTFCKGNASATKLVKVDTPPWITSLKVSKGKVQFKLTENAKVSFYAQKPTSGKLVAGKCKRAKKPVAKKSRCTLWVRASKSFTRSGKAGKRNSFNFDVVKLGLKSGKYRLYGVATDKAKNKGPSKTAGFRVKR